jgi:hypothetical protein
LRSRRLRRSSEVVGALLLPREAVAQTHGEPAGSLLRVGSETATSSVARMRPVARSGGTAALACTSVSVLRLFPDGFMQQPRVKRVVIHLHPAIRFASWMRVAASDRRPDSSPRATPGSCSDIAGGLGDGHLATTLAQRERSKPSDDAVTSAEAAGVESVPSVQPLLERRPVHGSHQDPGQQRLQQTTSPQRGGRHAMRVVLHDPGRTAVADPA